MRRGRKKSKENKEGRGEAGMERVGRLEGRRRGQGRGEGRLFADVLAGHKSL